MNIEIESIQRETTPLQEGDCHLVFDRVKSVFDYPIHFHPEYELNFIRNGQGSIRITGDHESVIKATELVLVGPNLVHGWQQGTCDTGNIHEITIQFQQNLYDASLLSRNVMKPIRDMLLRSVRGISFSGETIAQLESRILVLSKKSGFDAFIELTNLLFDLASSRNQQILAEQLPKNGDAAMNPKIQLLYDFIRLRFGERILLEEAAAHLNMTVISFSRLVKAATGKTFVGFLNDYRIGRASRGLTETDKTISEIAYTCGFNNLAHFNRLFRKLRNSTPTEFRKKNLRENHIHQVN